eukprot:2298934-Amphidinium_carterae.1
MACPASETALSCTTVEDIGAFVGLPQGVYSAGLAVLGLVDDRIVRVSLFTGNLSGISWIMTEFSQRLKN